MIFAGSISRWLLDIPTPASIPLRVLSRHRRVVNLVDDEGRMLALAHPDVGNGPFHILLAEAVPFHNLQPGLEAAWAGDELQLGPWTIHLSHAARWDPLLTPTRAAPSPRAWARARERAHAYITASLVEDMRPPAIARLLRGLDALCEEGGQGWREGLELLLGLGPGLTPAGDDVLLGFLARRWMQQDAPGPEEASVWRTMLPRTSRLSAAWLEHALAGRFAEPWHQLYQAMLAGDDESAARALARIASIGATSGKMALLGAFSMP